MSLTQRLTTMFTLVAAAVVLGLGVLFLHETELHFNELDRMVLRDKQLLLAQILQDAGSEDEARRRLSEAVDSHHGLSALVQDAQGQTVFQTRGFDPVLRPEMGSPKDAAGFGLWSGQGVAVHTLVFQVQPSFPLQPSLHGGPLRVLLAAATDHHRQFLHGLRRSLGLYTAGALVVCGLLAWLAVRHGLAPLRQMKSRAAAVSGQRLGERMPLQAVPVEMADLAQELNRMLDRLQQAIQRLDDYSSDLAHELRTPMSNLLTQTQVALAVKRDAATYRDILASNAEEFERLARMVSDMLFLARTERGLALPDREQFMARPEIAQLADFYDASAEEKRVRIHWQGDAAVNGNRLMFRRAVSNLLSNAVRHAPVGGEVHIRIARASANAGAGAGDATTVAIENNGEDIAPALLPRLFERFYRADPARAHLEAEGTGLGLAITRAIAESHGGHVHATSAQGRTCFTLSFPDATPDHPASAH